MNYVRIDHREGYCRGPVISAANYSDTPEQDNWYVEFVCNDCGAIYFKQVLDADAIGFKSIRFAETLEELS